MRGKEFDRPRRPFHSENFRAWPPNYCSTSGPLPSNTPQFLDALALDGVTWARAKESILMQKL